MGLENFGPADLKSLVGTDPNSTGLGGGMGIWLVLLILLLGGRNNLFGGFGNAAGTDLNGYGGYNNANQDNKFLNFETFEKINDVATQNVKSFCDLGQQVTNSQFSVQQEINGVRTALAQCCCDNQLALRDSEFRLTQLITDSTHMVEGQMSVFKQDVDSQLCDIRHQAEMDKRDVISEIEDSKDTIIGFLTQTKIDELTAENNSLKHAISQAEQTATLIASCGCGCPDASIIAKKA